MPRRPSTILGIEDPLEALLMDIAILGEVSKVPEEIKEPPKVPGGKKQSVKERIKARRRRLGIPSYRM